jgi:hypothetical protein
MDQDELGMGGAAAGEMLYIHYPASPSDCNRAKTNKGNRCPLANLHAGDWFP